LNREKDPGHWQRVNEFAQKNMEKARDEMIRTKARKNATISAAKGMKVMCPVPKNSGTRIIAILISISYLGPGRGSLRPNSVSFPYTAVITDIVTSNGKFPTTVEIAYLGPVLPRGVVHGERERVHVSKIKPMIKDQRPVVLKALPEKRK
jgi:hypothetical protein